MNKAIIIISKIVEVFMWVGSVLTAALTALSAFGRTDLFRFFTDLDPSSVEISAGFFSVDASAAGIIPNGVYVVFFLTFLATLVLVGLIFHNIHRIFKTAEGKSPFQPENIRMVRQIGWYCIAVPAVSIAMSIPTMILSHSAQLNIDMNVNIAPVLFGFIALSLSRFFAYGAELEQEVDGMI